MSSGVDFIAAAGDLSEKRVSAVFVQLLKDPAKMQKDRQYVIPVQQTLGSTVRGCVHRRH